MKRDFSKIILLLSAAMVGCQGADLDDNMGYAPQPEIVDVIISVDAKDDEADSVSIGTRVSVDEEMTDDGPRWALAWEDGDAVTGWDSSNYVAEFRMMDFNESNANQATFIGKATKGSTMRLIYPMNSSAVNKGASQYNIDLAKQSVEMGEDGGLGNHGASNLYMISDEFAVDAVGGDDSYPVMRHMLAGMRLAVTSCPEGYEVDRVVVKKLYNTAAVAFDEAVGDDGKIALSSKATGDITLLVNGATPFVAGETQYFPFTTTPFAVGDTADGVLPEIEFVFYFTNGQKASCTKDYSALETPAEIVAGTVNTLGVDLSGATFEDCSYTLEDFASMNTLETLPQDDVWYISSNSETATDYDNLELALVAASDAGREIHLIFTANTRFAKPTFEKCKAKFSLEAPNSTSVQANVCVGCTNLTYIDFPKLKSTGNLSFNECDALTSVSLPSLITLGSNSFKGCDNLIEVHLPEVTNVGYYAFRDCPELTTLDMPKIKTLGGGIIWNAKKLTKIVLGTEDTGVEEFNTSIDSKANKQFSTFHSIDTENIDLEIKLAAGSEGAINGNVLTIADYNSDNDDTYNYSYTFKTINGYGGAGNKTYTFTSIAAFNNYSGTFTDGAVISINDESVTEVGADVASALAKITANSSVSLSLPYAVNIASGALVNEYLSALDLGLSATGVRSIADDAFSATNTEDIVLTLTTPSNADYTISGNTLTTSGGTAYNFKQVLIYDAKYTSVDTFIAAVNNGEIPEGSEVYIKDPIVTTISDEFVAAVRSLGYDEYIKDDEGNDILISSTDVKALIEIELTGVAAMKPDTFQGCTALRYAIFNNKDYILVPERCFQYCSSLETFIATNVTSVGNVAFKYCEQLANVELPVCEKTANLSFNKTAIESISLPAATEVGSSCFLECPNLKNIYIPNVTIVNYGAFKGCTTLITLEIPKLNEIKSKGSFLGGSRAIETLYLGCSSDNSVATGTGVTTLDDLTFNSANTKIIDLYIKVGEGANYVIEGNTITITDGDGSTPATFNSITIVDTIVE